MHVELFSKPYLIGVNVKNFNFHFLNHLIGTR